MKILAGSWETSEKKQADKPKEKKNWLHIVRKKKKWKLKQLNTHSEVKEDMNQPLWFGRVELNIIWKRTKTAECSQKPISGVFGWRWHYPLLATHHHLQYIALSTNLESVICLTCIFGLWENLERIHTDIWQTYKLQTIKFQTWGLNPCSAPHCLWGNSANFLFIFYTKVNIQLL